MSIHEDLKHNDSIASSLSTSSQKKLIMTSSNHNQSPAMSGDPESADLPVKKSQDHFTPPDGGVKAWLVAVASFLCNGVIFGIINSYGVLFVHLKKGYEDGDDAATKASLVGSLAIGMTFLLSPVSSILVDKFGIRRTAFTGGLIAFLGMLMSAFVIKHVELLYLTYGLMFGGGSSLTYTPSLVILGHYFKKNMGLVNGFVTIGSSIFTVAMPHILKGLLTTPSVGLKGCFLFLSGITSIQMAAALTFQPLMPQAEEQDQGKGCCAKIINVNNWKNPKYVIWSLAIPSALFGYFVPYVHIVQHVKDTMPDEDGGILLTCIAVTSGLGRLTFGKIADLPNVNRILLQQISFISIGCCTMLLVAAPYFTGFEFNSMIMFALIMGIFDGCFITMLGPIAYDICGPSGASQAIGFLLGLCSFPLTFGPLLAGYLYDWLGNYTVAFIVAGIPPIVGAIFMCLIYRVGNQVPDNPEVEANVTTHLVESRTAISNLSAETSAKTEDNEEESLLNNGSSVIA